MKKKTKGNGRRPEQRSEEREEHAWCTGLDEGAGVRRPEWRGGAEKEQQPRPAPRDKEEKKREGLKRKTPTLHWQAIGQHSTGKQSWPTLCWQAKFKKFAPENAFQTAILRKGDLTWREFIQISFGSKTHTLRQKPRQNTTEKHKTVTNHRKQKFAPAKLFQTATLRKTDLTWREFFKTASGAKHHILIQKPRQSATENTRPQQTTKSKNYFGPEKIRASKVEKGEHGENIFKSISGAKPQTLTQKPRQNTNHNKPPKAKTRSRKFTPNSDPEKNRPDMERIFQDSFGSKTPHPNTKT